MPVTIVDAIANLVKHPILKVSSEYRARNRANAAGDAFEEYVKDLFAGTIDCNDLDRMERYEQVFSYLGNSANPPDAMLWRGDAIEVKKIETRNADLALNSSYPKHTLKSDSTMISAACRDAEDWREKDMLYIVGYVHNGILKDLAMVYGLDYCASETCYNRLKSVISDGVNSVPGVEFAPTKELARVNRVDPLGITYLRVRGMWGIENPWMTFNYVYRRDERQKFNMMVLIGEKKWNGIDNTAELVRLTEVVPKLMITDVKIKDPDNPARLNNAKLITFMIS